MATGIGVKTVSLVAGIAIELEVESFRKLHIEANRLGFQFSLV